MRINVYAEEITENVELVKKTTVDGEFTGLRFYLYLPVTQPNGSQSQGPFIHRPGDDDSSAITFWGKKSLRNTLQRAILLLDNDRFVSTKNKK